MLQMFLAGKGPGPARNEVRRHNAAKHEIKPRFSSAQWLTIQEMCKVSCGTSSMDALTVYAEPILKVRSP